MKKKLLLMALAVTMMSTALVGCGGKEQQTVGGEGKLQFSVTTAITTAVLQEQCLNTEAVSH